MNKKAILFDLDGTLLPMDNDAFVQEYLRLLAGTAMKWGYEDPKRLVEGVWKGTKAMIKNDGTRLNREAFWNTFDAFMEKDCSADMKKFDGFYVNEFQQAKVATGENSLAMEAVALAKKKAQVVILATNPLFPPCAVETRLSWVDLGFDEFAMVTNYENSHFCKPNPAYYLEILEKFDLQPEDCLMVGNDMDEDIVPARGLGMTTFLLTDSLLNRSGKSLDEADYHGTFADLLKFLS